jgi:adenylate kinase
MVKERLGDPDATDGFLLDGFPRNVPQAKVLDDMLSELSVKIDIVLELIVDNDEVVRRLSGRRTCRGCGKIWHIEFDPTAHPGKCDRCGGELFQRDDDQAETIRHRLDVYYEQTAPLIGYYAERGILVGIDAMGPVDDVTERASAALRPYARS